MININKNYLSSDNQHFTSVDMEMNPKPSLREKKVDSQKDKISAGLESSKINKLENDKFAKKLRNYQITKRTSAYSTTWDSQLMKEMKSDKTVPKPETATTYKQIKDFELMHSKEPSIKTELHEQGAFHVIPGIGTGLGAASLRMNGVVKFLPLQGDKIRESDYLLELESHQTSDIEGFINTKLKHEPMANPKRIGEGIEDKCEMVVKRVSPKFIQSLKDGDIIAEHSYPVLAIRLNSSSHLPETIMFIKNPAIPTMLDLINDTDPSNNFPCKRCDEGSHKPGEKAKECSFIKGQLNSIEGDVKQHPSMVSIIDKINVLQKITLKGENLVLEKGTKNSEGKEFLIEIARTPLKNMIVK